jgi:hypothetical protein
MLDSSGRHFPAAEASANKGSARTGTDVCERRWWNSPGCGCAGNPTAPCRLGSGGWSADADEILVESARPFRANVGPKEHAFVDAFNAQMLAVNQNR